MLYLATLPLVQGHGVMVRPAVWSDTENFAWGYDNKGFETNIGCGKLDLPEDTAFEIESGHKPDCLQHWFTGGAETLGVHTLPTELMQPDIDCSQEGTEELYLNYPWSAPGRAEVYSPCGAMGGYPYGCSGILGGEYVSAKEFGDVCPCDGKSRPSESFGCGGFAFGGLAHQYYWPDAPTTEWRAESVQEVAWFLPNDTHGGGYSYRLCRLPAEGISGLTEECFKEGHLEFSGTKQWIYYGNEYIESDSKVEVNATRINEGTFPPRSMWTAVPFQYPDDQIFQQSELHGHVVDKVKIPSSLEPGEYVLSFRWDCKCTSQVFNSCANIQVTE